MKISFDAVGCIAPSNPTEANVVFRVDAMASFKSVTGTGEQAGAEPDPSSDATKTGIESGGSAGGSLSAWKNYIEIVPCRHVWLHMQNYRIICFKTKN